MLTMKDLRKFVADHPNVSDDCVLLAAESDPSGNFDNAGFPLTKLAHDHSGSDDPGDLGVIYLLADGIEPKFDVLERPLTLDETRAKLDDDNRLEVIVRMGFDELTDLDLEGVNDLAEERILERGILADISYTVVGCEIAQDQGSGDVLVKVEAEVDLSLYEDMDDEMVPPKHLNQ